MAEPALLGDSEGHALQLAQALRKISREEDSLDALDRERLPERGAHELRNTRGVLVAPGEKAASACQGPPRPRAEAARGLPDAGRRGGEHSWRMDLRRAA